MFFYLTPKKGINKLKQRDVNLKYGYFNTYKAMNSKMSVSFSMVLKFSCSTL
ncbi:hypothetical protein FVB9288_03320 [Flavobacterium sp. CECT 9288]|nr:hypothetical protein FVB9288_03320 [Flavobacterium sp. CECT 9288]